MQTGAQKFSAAFSFSFDLTKSESMVKNRHENRNQFVFTLDEESNTKPPYSSKKAERLASPAQHQEATPAWERTLEQMRQLKKRVETTAQVHAPNQTVRQSQPAVTTRMNKPFEQEQSKRAIPAEAHKTRTARSSAKTTQTTQQSFSLQSQQTNEVLLDPVQRERAYRTYLQQWQQKHTLEVKEQESVLNDTALLIQEDWLAAQNCLQSAVDINTPTCCTISLQGNQSSIVEENHVTADVNQADEINAVQDTTNQPAIHVHMHVIEPRGIANRGVACISEQELLQQLSEKLRPHLADVLAGMVRVAVQRHTAGLVTTLQRELLAEVPTAVEEVLKHNLTQVMNKIKKNQR